MKYRPSSLSSASAAICVATFLSTASESAAANFSLAEQTGLIPPSTRGASQTSYYGWETFNDSATRAQPINDSTPDLGTSISGALFRTTNGEDHVLGSGNFYLFAGNPAEEVTAVTAGIAGAGFTSIILQAVTAFDPFPGPWSFGSILGVEPQVIQGVNANGLGQLWVKYDLPGNEGQYTIPFSAVGQHYSIDRFTVDTFWSATAFQPDVVVVPEPSVAVTLAAVGLASALRRRRSPSGNV